MVKYSPFNVKERCTKSADFDGKEFNRYPFRFDIPSFEGTKRINSLKCFPLRYHEQENDVRQRLQLRGKQFRHFCSMKKGHQMFQYDGDALFNRGIQEIIESEMGGGAGPFGLGFIMASELQQKGEVVCGSHSNKRCSMVLMGLVGRPQDSTSKRIHPECW